MVNSNSPGGLHDRFPDPHRCCFGSRDRWLVYQSTKVSGSEGLICAVRYL